MNEYEKTVIETVAKTTLEQLFSQITPIIRKHFQKRKSQERIENSIEQHLKSTKQKVAIINSLAFPNRSISLLEYYIPLRVRDNADNQIVISHKNDLLSNHEKVLIVDSAGMGKSTISKRVALDLIENSYHIPIFIELRNIKDRSIPLEIKRQLSLKEDDTEALLEALPLAILLDGFDEVGKEEVSTLIDNINDFVTNYIGTPILLTSRPEANLSKIKGFEVFNIERFKQSEAYSLIKKYDGDGGTSEKLIKELKEEKSVTLQQFLETPLYVSLLYSAYKHKPIIPRRKDLFFNQVYEALYEDHDLSKEVGYVRKKHSNLDAVEFKKVLKRFGFYCLMHDGLVELSKEKAHDVINEIIKGIDEIETKSSFFYKDLITTVPLFIEEGATIRWSHKSFMEYFAASFICYEAKDKQVEIINKLINSNSPFSFLNVLELCADIDYTTFRVEVFKKILERYLEHFENIYKLGVKKGISIDEISKRSYLTFGKEARFFITKNKRPSFDTVVNDEVSNQKVIDSGRRVVGSQLVTKDYSYTSVIILDFDFELLNLFLEIKPGLKKHYHSRKRDVFNNTLAKDQWLQLDNNSNSRMNSKRNFSIINELLAPSRSALYVDVKKLTDELNNIHKNQSNGLSDLIDNCFS